jgi:hypothetical protein
MSLDILNANFEGITGDRKLADGISAQGRIGRRGQLMQSNMSSFYGELSERRRLYFGSTPAAGVTIPIYSSTTQQFVLANPLGSQKKARLLKAVIGYISGTMVAGHLCYANQTLINSAITGTAALIQNGYLGAAAGPSGSGMNLYTAATVVAFTYLFPMGLSQVAQTAAQTNTPWQMIDNIDGGITVPPGSAIAIAANVAASMVATIGLLWEEEDLDA